ncbi:MAG: VanZ family protein, partial [Butyrivibrio sp.]|nr:VanZ family protein [Butyrivibrio sp.]
MKKTTGRTIDLMFLSLTFSTALVLALIIHLTRQSGADTISTQNLIVSLFPELFPKHYHNAIWLMLELNSARKMAHIYEFGALGLFMTLMIITSPVGKKLRNNTASTKIIFLYSIGICAFASFCDQVHKTFIVYRHFDVHDLVLDAV